MFGKNAFVRESLDKKEVIVMICYNAAVVLFSASTNNGIITSRWFKKNLFAMVRVSVIILTTTKRSLN